MNFPIRHLSAICALLLATGCGSLAKIDYVGLMTDGRDGWQRSFRAAAERLGVAFDQPRRINEPEVVESLARFGARALVSGS